MKITIDNKVLLTNNDTYVMEATNDFIILNHDNNGIIVFNDNFIEEKIITTTTQGYIYRFMYDYKAQTIALYFPDEQIIEVISLSNEFPLRVGTTNLSSVISDFYFWQNKDLFFATYDNYFYQLSLTNQKITSIAEKSFAELFPAYYAFYHTIKMHAIRYNVNPLIQSFIYYDEAINSFICQNDTEKIQSKCTAPLGIDCHDASFDQDLWLLVTENSLIVTYNNTTIFLERKNKAEIFLKAKIITENNTLFIIALVGNKSDNKRNILVKYRCEK